MLWLAKYVFALSFFINAHPASIQPNDYNYVYGGKTKNVIAEIEVSRERENGLFYNGIFVRTQELYDTFAEIKINEANNINKQYIYKNLLTLPTGNSEQDILKFRTLYQWTRWKDPKWMGGVEINFDTKRITTRYEYDTNFIDRHISRFNFEYTWLQDDIWYLMPYYKLENHDGFKVWKVGIEYGIDLVEYSMNLLELKDRRSGDD